MSKRNHSAERLLAGTLHDDWTTGQPAKFARRAAAHARSRQRTRKLAAAAGALAVLAVAMLFSYRSAPTADRDVAPASHVSVSVAPRTPARGYEIISDEELLASVRDRQLLAVAGSDGKREIVVLANE